MTATVGNAPGLVEFLRCHDHVVRVSSALDFMTRDALRWQVSSGRWQQPCRGIVVTHSGPLAEEQRMRTTLLATGREAVLAGLTAARLDGFRGFTDSGAAIHPVYVLLPAGAGAETGASTPS